MKILFAIAILALCACPKKAVEPVVQEDASVVVMDAMVIDLGTLPD